jgi:hypothetical protein
MNLFLSVYYFHQSIIRITLMLTQDRLKELLHYCPETGVFTWIHGNGKSVKAGDAAKNVDVNGYPRTKINRVLYKLHKLAFLYMTGKLPDRKTLVDHKDGNKTNNSWSNLRLVDCTSSNRNRRFVRGDLSGIELTKFGTYRVRVRYSGKSVGIGSFRTKEEAVAAKFAALEKYGYHSNHGR